MRISDWSSDVCSSDLLTCGVLHEFRVLERRRADHHTRYTQVKPALHGGPFTDAPAKLHMTGKSFDDALHRSGIHRPSCKGAIQIDDRSEEHTSELQSLMRISYAVFCLTQKKKKQNKTTNTYQHKYYNHK